MVRPSTVPLVSVVASVEPASFVTGSARVMLQFVEDWFPPASQRVLARLACSTFGLSGRVVEVGSWEGRSTVVLANAVAPEVVHAVDHWEGSPTDWSGDLAAKRDVHASFLHNVAVGTAGNVVEHRMGWRDYFAEDRSPCRFVFIDAEHTYDEVLDNILAVMPLLVPGGIVCGDDIAHEPVASAVLVALGPFEHEASVWWRRARG